MGLLRPRVHRKQRLQHLRRHRRFPHRDLRRFQRHRRSRRIAGQQNAKRPISITAPPNDAGRGRRAFPHPSFSWQHISHRVFYLLDGIRPEKSIQYGTVDKVSQQPSLYSKKYGCPAIDPVVIVKYLLVGFLYGIPSERQIERRIQTDIAT